MRRVLYILSASLTAMALGLWLGNRFALDAANRDMQSRAESSAEIWLNHLFEHEQDLLPILNADRTIDPLTREAIENLAWAANVYEFKIFDSSGRLVFTLFADRDADNSNRDAAMYDVEQSVPRQVLRSGQPITELVVDSKETGKPSHYAEIYRPIVRDGKIIGVYEVYMDLSRAAEDIQRLYRYLVFSISVLIVGIMLIPFATGLFFWFQLKTTARNLDLARRRAEEAERIKTAFLANMSHEIRTPMNGVIAMAELLEQSDLTTEQLSMTSTISSSAVALLSIINDILDFSKIEADKLTVRNEAFDLLQLIEEVTTLFSPAAAAKGVETCVECTLDPPLIVEGDPARLRQCLLNLVGNAVKFTPYGHVHIWLNRTDDGQIVIRITDTGVGIPEDKLDTIFEEFSQIDDTATREFEGTGLGLAITMRLLRLMGGSVTARSQNGAGSTFELRLPLPSAPIPEPDIEFWKSARTAMLGTRVLVVEDLPCTRSAIRTMLHSLGARPTTARNAEEAISLARTLQQQGTPFDVGLIDCGLPDMSGDQLLSALRDVCGSATPPCVLMLRADREIGGDTLRTFGFHGALRKPLGQVSLARMLSSAIGQNLDGASHQQDGKARRTADFSANTILLAEDNATNRLVAEKLLAPTGAQLVTAKNGQEAVQLFDRITPDLVLMDVSMPIMNGYDATRSIRQIEARGGRRAVPIVALTANAMSEDRAACLDAGMTDFLAKPVRRAELLDMLATHLNPEETTVRRA